jgi:hypothetical protein
MLSFLDLEQWDVTLAGATAHPIGSWVTQHARNLAMTRKEEGRAVNLLIPRQGHQVRRGPSMKSFEASAFP